jgi:uncharacterized protein (TIRG00374 family)
MKRYLIFVLGVAVSVFCLYLAFRNTTFSELYAAIQSANYFTLPIILVMLFVFYWLKAVRWSWLLGPVAPLTTRQLFPPTMIGFAANNMLPAHLGEFVRVFVVRRDYRVPVATVLSTVVLERIFDALAILTLFGIGLSFSADLPDDYRQKAAVIGCLAVLGSLVVVAYLIWTDWFLGLTSRILDWCPFLPASLTGKVTDLLRTGAHGLHALRDLKMVLLIAINSLVQWTLNGAMAYVALRSFGIDVSPTAGLIITGVTAIGVTVPSTPGYFGVIQMCFAVSMAAQAVKPDPSLVLGASLYYHISNYIPVTLLGVYFLNRAGLHLGDLTSAAEHSADDQPTLDEPADESGQPVTDAVPAIENTAPVTEN